MPSQAPHSRYAAAQFFPAKVAAALLERSGGQLVAPVRVLNISDKNDRRIVETDVGDVEARVVVVATNGWTPELLAGVLSVGPTSLLLRR